jgi:SSS family solute:Na+ symporter
MIGLYTRWFNPWALLIGWAAGMVAGTWMAVDQNFNGSFPLPILGWTFPGYTALYTLILNLALTILLTPAFNLFSAAKPVDQTVAADYHA